MKNCSNCFWYYNEMNHSNIENFSNEEQDSTIGNCILQKDKEDQDFYFPCAYPLGIEEVPQIFYDEQYLGPGYFLLYMNNGEIERFLKFYFCNEIGFPTFALRAYEKGSVDRPDQGFRSICFPFDLEEPLYKLVKPLQEKLMGKWIVSTDPMNQGQNNLQFIEKGEKIVLVASKDIYGVKEATNFIDILIGDSYSCKYYQEFLKFYGQLEKISPNKISEEKLQKILTMKKI